MVILYIKTAKIQFFVELAIILYFCISIHLVIILRYVLHLYYGTKLFIRNLRYGGQYFHDSGIFAPGHTYYSNKKH